MPIFTQIILWDIDVDILIIKWLIDILNQTPLSVSCGSCIDIINASNSHNSNEHTQPTSPDVLGLLKFMTLVTRLIIYTCM